MTSKQDKIIRLIVQLQMMSAYAHKYYDHPLGQPDYKASIDEKHRYHRCTLGQVSIGESEPINKLRKDASEIQWAYINQIYLLRKRLECALLSGEEIDVDEAEKEVMSIEFDKEGFDIVCKKLVAAVDLEILIEKAVKKARDEFNSIHK